MIIYKATNKVNGKCYIGQTTKSLEQRRSEHSYQKNKVSCPYFFNAINKYGSDDFKWEILCECDSMEELNDMEFHYIKQYNSFGSGGYNLKNGGDGSVGFRFTDEQKRKMRETQKGHIVTKEQRQNISKSMIDFWKSEDSIQNREMLSKQKIEEWKDPNSTYNSKDFRKKLSDTQSGDKNGMYGKTHTEETKKKISDKAKLRTSEKNPMYGKKGVNNPNFNRENKTKKWILTLPDGDVITVTSLNKFARDYEEDTGIKLFVSNLSSVASGKLKHYKKIKCKMIMI